MIFDSWTVCLHPWSLKRWRMKVWVGDRSLGGKLNNSSSGLFISFPFLFQELILQFSDKYITFQLPLARQEVKDLLGSPRNLLLFQSIYSPRWGWQNFRIAPHETSVGNKRFVTTPSFFLSQIFLNKITCCLTFIIKVIMVFNTIATIASFGGRLLKLTHKVTSTNCEMALNLYLPPQATKQGSKVPVLFYLSGLTCTGDNCAEKGFFQHGASQKGIAVVYPDTSPSAHHSI